MNIPSRLLILQRLTALLQGVSFTLPDGTTYAMTDRVVRGRNIIGEELEPPWLSILDAPRPDTPEFVGAGQSRKDDWTILITGTAPDDKMNPSDNGFWLVAAVEERLARIVAEDKQRGKATFPEHYLLCDGDPSKPLITKLEVAPPVVRPPEDKLSSSAFFFLPIRVGIAGAIGSPYTSVV